MTNLYEHGLYLSLYPPLPSLYSNPWRGQVFPLILFTSLSPHSQSPRTQQQPSPPSSANNNKVSQVENYYVRLSSSCPNPLPGLHLYSSPALQPSVPHQRRDAAGTAGTTGRRLTHLRRSVQLHSSGL